VIIGKHPFLYAKNTQVRKHDNSNVSRIRVAMTCLVRTCKAIRDIVTPLLCGASALRVDDFITWTGEFSKQGSLHRIMMQVPRSCKELLLCCATRLAAQDLLYNVLSYLLSMKLRNLYFDQAYVHKQNCKGLDARLNGSVICEL
jgi:hypothetical protein